MTTYTLMLLCFKQSEWFSENTAHWGLSLAPDNTREGILYHASKESDTTLNTYYRPVNPFTPTRSTKLRRAVTVATGITLSHSTMDQYCRATAANRPFDYVVNNCQAFCTEILVKLRNNGTISVDQFDELPSKGFQPMYLQSTSRRP